MSKVKEFGAAVYDTIEDGSYFALAFLSLVSGLALGAVGVLLYNVGMLVYVLL